jgi:hypothetical protein
MPKKIFPTYTIVPRALIPKYGGKWRAIDDASAAGTDENGSPGIPTNARIIANAEMTMAPVAEKPRTKNGFL